MNLSTIPYSQVPVGGFCIWKYNTTTTFNVFKPDPSAAASGVIGILMDFGLTAGGALTPDTHVAYDPNAGIQL